MSLNTTYRRVVLTSSAVVCIYMMIIAQALGACAEPVKGSVAVEVVLVSLAGRVYGRERVISSEIA
eukprot:scaffold74555_cov42-Phaeocystis_antarctica.AAC.1